MADESSPKAEIRSALVRLLVNTMAEGSHLDSEDREMLVRYHCREITYEQLMAFAERKSVLMNAQIRRPQ